MSRVLEARELRRRYFRATGVLSGEWGTARGGRGQTERLPFLFLPSVGVNIGGRITLKGTPPADKLPENVPSVPDFPSDFRPRFPRLSPISPIFPIFPKVWHVMVI